MIHDVWRFLLVSITPQSFTAGQVLGLNKAKCSLGEKDNERKHSTFLSQIQGPLSIFSYKEKPPSNLDLTIKYY